MNAHSNIRVTQAQIGALLDDLNLFLADDEQFKLDMMEGETDLFSVVRQLLNANEDDDGTIASLDQQMADRTSRKDRAKARIDKRKQAITTLMDTAQITKLPLAEATISLRTLAPRPKVVNPDELPDAFCKFSTVRKPDTDAIAAAVEGGATIPGVVMTNGGSSLTIRRK